jgi:uncharacterized protein (DUF1330 family)
MDLTKAEEPMPAYLISTIEITDPRATRSTAGKSRRSWKYGGRFLVRGGKIHYLEGEWRPKRVVVVEFDSVDKAKAFNDAPEYAQAKAMRHRTSVSSVIVVEGL